MRRANAIAYRTEEVELRARSESRPSLMTPARRAGLKALEREFSELLSAYESRRAQTAAA